MDNIALVQHIEERIHNCPKTDKSRVNRLIRKVYRDADSPISSRVPVLFVQSPSQAIAEATKIYRQSMNKVEEGFMLRLQLPNADPILVRSGVAYPAFLRWDFAASLFNTNTHVKTDVWGYNPHFTRMDNEGVMLRQITRDLINLVGLHLETWKRWTEAGDHTQVFRDNTGYWPIARNAAFGRNRRFPGSALGRVRLEQTNETDRINTLTELASQAFMVFPYDQFAMVIDFPEAIHMDGQGRLGRFGGPAIEWRDGTGTYAVSGRMVPKATCTGRLTFNKIKTQNNAEVKRVLIAEYGEEAFLKRIGAKVQHVDEYGILYHAPALEGENEIFAMVAVTNSSPEPDGTYKNYFLRVNPRARTALEAVGESFRMDGQGRITDWRLQSQLGREGHKYEPYAES